ncbi:hypothetical protein CAMGR0001_0471 [Campylobacter gracilis RM3268]|uniref:Uncharacterized protein n=1 Tax=Campylobacter gracilis RM3268 TaxID=553220 RepID=C8PHM5_9BACT|nr:hypothetical protein CAMGR0001_0471 [Campylobacter gracilis RM3268]
MVLGSSPSEPTTTKFQLFTASKSAKFHKILCAIFFSEITIKFRFITSKDKACRIIPALKCGKLAIEFSNLTFIWRPIKFYFMASCGRIPLKFLVQGDVHVRKSNEKRRNFSFLF